MRIGVDLDNTIICYDRLFHRAAQERALIPADVAVDKNAIKTWIQQHSGNDTWTALQGEVYGNLLQDAEPFPGVIDFFQRCRSAGCVVCILSHKSVVPARGQQIDLRLAARAWLARRGWFGVLGLQDADVEFHATRAGKVRAIARRECDVFIDDLPEVFAEPGFPSRTNAILFDPQHLHAQNTAFARATSWRDIETAVFAAHVA
jgi:hypothetical protein